MRTGKKKSFQKWIKMFPFVSPSIELIYFKILFFIFNSTRWVIFNTFISGEKKKEKNLFYRQDLCVSREEIWQNSRHTLYFSVFFFGSSFEFVWNTWFVCIRDRMNRLNWANQLEFERKITSLSMKMNKKNSFKKSSSYVLQSMCDRTWLR